MYYFINKKIIVYLLIVTLIIILSAFNKKPQLHNYTIKYDKERFNPPNIPADNPMTYEGVALGRLLFYDSMLSSDYTISCSSCHKQEYSFSDGGVQYSRGVNGKVGKRNTMTLVNLVWQTSFFWDGRASSLEEVIHFPIMDTLEMNLDTSQLIIRLNNHKFYPKYFKRVFNTNTITFKQVSKAIAQFLRTINIDGYNPRFIKMFNEFKSNEDASKTLNDSSFIGMYARTVSVCGKCHPGEGRGDTKFADNLITKGELISRFKITNDSIDISKFKVPSLINIKLSAPYMHDGRFNTIDEVTNHYSIHLNEIRSSNPAIFSNSLNDSIIISELDINNFTKFFDLFTDSTIIKSKQLSNPFNKKNFNWHNFPYF